MAAALTQFRVIGLHGRRDIYVEFGENKLILVGENGSGKSTLSNLIYFFLTRQWNRLREYRFQEIRAMLGGFDLSVTPEKLEAFASHQHQTSIALRHLPPHLRFEVRNRVAQLAFPDLLDEEQLTLFFSEELHLSPSRARELLRNYQHEIASNPPELQIIGKQIASSISDQFLYLPTYRRIEQDLKSIFRGLEIESELQKFRERLARRMATHFVELIEFGMEDVEQTIAKRMGQIKDSVRTGLDNLTGTYLRDVIRGVHTAVDVEKVRVIEPSTLESMFARIDDRTLPSEDKRRLIAKVQEMAGLNRIRQEDQVIAHFLSKLIQLYTEQEASEKNVREFVRVCNEYLDGKKLVYDNINYTIFIRQSVERGEQLNLDGDSLALKNLSSGEKQIVSLFSHIYLSGAPSFFVIIDEPELSLSVPWQRRFLPDIVGSGLCGGLIAATHSPFVWENQMEPYVRSIREFTIPHHVIR